MKAVRWLDSCGGFQGAFRPFLYKIAKNICIDLNRTMTVSYTHLLPKVTYSQKFAFAQRSGAMKAPVGLLSDRTVLRKQDGGARPDKFAFAKRSAAMKAPVGLLSDRTVLHSKMEGPCPDKFTLTWLDFCGNLFQQFNITYLQ